MNASLDGKHCIIVNHGWGRRNIIKRVATVLSAFAASAIVASTGSAQDVKVSAIIHAGMITGGTRERPRSQRTIKLDRQRWVDRRSGAGYVMRPGAEISDERSRFVLPGPHR